MQNFEMIVKIEKIIGSGHASAGAWDHEALKRRQKRKKKGLFVDRSGS